MFRFISIELVNEDSIIITDPTSKELSNIDYWLNSERKFYTVESKGKIEKINKDYVVKVTIYEQ